MRLYVLRFPPGDCPLPEPFKTNLQTDIVRQYQIDTGCSYKSALRWFANRPYLLVGGGEREIGNGLGSTMGCASCLATKRELKPVAYCEPIGATVIIFGVCKKCVALPDLMEALSRKALNAINKNERFYEVEAQP